MANVSDLSLSASYHACMLYHNKSLCKFDDFQIMQAHQLWSVADLASKGFNIRCERLSILPKRYCLAKLLTNLLSNSALTLGNTLVLVKKSKVCSKGLKAK